jgi:SAM-dependent methyltransferase
MSLLQGPRHLGQSTGPGGQQGDSGRPDYSADIARLRHRGLGRSAQLARLFRLEQSEPDRYYECLAEDTAIQLEEYTSLAGRTVLDIGGGPGHFTAAFRRRGAQCCLIEPDVAELASRGATPRDAVLGDGCALPVSDGRADVCFSSNVLEHVADPVTFIDEMVRVTKPDGLIYLSFTNWFSPWGGHEMSPWHYLGATRAEARYVRTHDRLPKNRPGAGLYPIHVGPTLRLLRSRQHIAVVDARPRYYPGWCRPVLRMPLAREVVTWNLLVILRRLG